MCRIHTTEELASILDTMADLFAWKRRKGLAELAIAARYPSRPWRHAPPDVAAPSVAPGLHDPQSV